VWKGCDEMVLLPIGGSVGVKLSVGKDLREGEKTSL